MKSLKIEVINITIKVEVNHYHHAGGTVLWKSGQKEKLLIARVKY